MSEEQIIELTRRQDKVDQDIARLIAIVETAVENHGELQTAVRDIAIALKSNERIQTSRGIYHSSRHRATDEPTRTTGQ